MNRTELGEALMSTIVDYISDQVVVKYIEASKTATVIFTGALIGYKDAVESLNTLKAQGWKLTVVMSKAAKEVIGEDRIKNDVDPDAIYVEGAPVNSRQLVNDSQFVIIPALTINTAAKIANCIADNLVTNMVLYAMTSGKPIIAAVDGACPDNKVREKIGFKVTKAFKDRMRGNLIAMLEYGIILTTDKSLAEKTDEVFAKSFDFKLPEQEEEKEPDCGCVAKMERSTSIKLDKKVIGRVDIAKNASYQTIIVASDALVTGLAADEAYNRGITIVKE